MVVVVVAVVAVAVVVAVSEDVCPTCKGEGAVYDSICLDDTCAHVGVYVQKKTKNGKTYSERKEIMPCPRRVCPALCSAGKWHREMLQKRARLQEEALNRGGT